MAQVLMRVPYLISDLKTHKGEQGHYFKKCDVQKLNEQSLIITFLNPSESSFGFFFYLHSY